MVGILKDGLVEITIDCEDYGIIIGHRGETLDVCASRAGHRAGKVSFMPLSDPRPVHFWTGGLIRLGLAGPVTYEVWKSWLSGRPVPRWVFRGFHDRG